MALTNNAHRPGSLKQTNKLHKTGRHRSKGAIDNALKGKSSIKVISRKHKQIVRKEQRRNQANQIRKNKREETISKKRVLGSVQTAPFLVCILPLNSQIDPRSALYMFENCDETSVINRTESGVTHITMPRFKQRFSFILPAIGRGKELAALDCLKVCDTTILLLSANAEEDEIIDEWGQHILHMSIAQGIPTPIVSLMDLEAIAPKHKAQWKTTVQKLVTKSFPNEKIMCLDTNTDALNHLRRIGSQKQKSLQHKDNRPHLYGEAIDYIIDSVDSEMGILKITGFLRGNPLDVNGLVHIPDFGDFQIKQIDAALDKYKFIKGRDETTSIEMTDVKEKEETESTRVLCVANPLRQVSLQFENIPDAMDAEQPMPTDEEIAFVRDEEAKKRRLVKRIPKGMSEYQACWIPDVEEIDDNEDVESDDEFMSCKSENSDGEFEHEFDEEKDECETVIASEAPVNDEKYDLELDLQEERETFNKIKEARRDKLWPDEIDTPLDIPARHRFQKYRGLESFRTSPWDIKENLPYDYARIFQFKNFDRTKRRIIKEAVDVVDGVQPGWYITIHIKNVSKTKWQLWQHNQSSLQQNNQSLIVYGLLPHEHQMSVVNVILKRMSNSTVPIKSKDQLMIQCGYRRFVVNPIFSAHTNGDKHKYECFFRTGETVVATFYAPIQFPPVPVLCFQATQKSAEPNTSAASNGSGYNLTLMASGCVLSCNPDRIILKRIVLSGHPLKINHKTATLRYMFFNKEDIDYFRPVKLRTKYGRWGHIKDSLGTHGHMKCIFNGQLKSCDTAFMYLYKRVFPNWTYEPTNTIEIRKETFDSNKMIE